MSLTIKQAFEALSDACAAGMKNPFFVMRRLKDSFADVASKVDGGGDKVTVTPITDSGTKIATIKVNNTTSELYAPDSSSTYSTTEHIIGKWIDGKDLYELVVELNNPTSSSVNYDTFTIVSLTDYNIGEVVQAFGTWKRKISETGAFTAPIGYYEAVQGGALVKGSIRFNTANNLQYSFIVPSGQTVPYAQIIIRYTKVET